MSAAVRAAAVGLVLAGVASACSASHEPTIMPAGSFVARWTAQSRCARTDAGSFLFGCGPPAAVSECGLIELREGWWGSPVTGCDGGRSLDELERMVHVDLRCEEGSALESQVTGLWMVTWDGECDPVTCVSSTSAVEMHGTIGVVDVDLLRGSFTVTVEARRDEFVCEYGYEMSYRRVPPPLSPDG